MDDLRIRSKTLPIQLKVAVIWFRYLNWEDLT